MAPEALSMEDGRVRAEKGRDGLLGLGTAEQTGARVSRAHAWQRLTEVPVTLRKESPEGQRL